MRLTFETRWGGKVDIEKDQAADAFVATLSVWRWERESQQVLAQQALEAKTFDAAADEAQTLWGWHKDRKSR